MTNDNLRKTIRIKPEMAEQLKTLMDVGHWMKESELLREAISIGLEEMHKRYNFEF